MSWTAMGIICCLVFIVFAVVCTMIPQQQRRPKNQRVPGVLPPPSPSCNRDYVP